jgi:hypothetical protein
VQTTGLACSIAQRSVTFGCGAMGYGTSAPWPSKDTPKLHTESTRPGVPYDPQGEFTQMSVAETPSFGASSDRDPSQRYRSALRSHVFRCAL